MSSLVKFTVKNALYLCSFTWLSFTPSFKLSTLPDSWHKYCTRQVFVCVDELVDDKNDDISEVAELLVLTQLYRQTRTYSYVTFLLNVCSQPSTTTWVGRLGWLRSTVGRTPVFGRRTDPVLRWRVTTMWVNRSLQVSQLGHLSLSSFRDR